MTADRQHSHVQLTIGPHTAPDQRETVVCHSPLAAPDAIVDCARQALEIPSESFRSGIVTERGVRIAADGRGRTLTHVVCHHRDCGFEALTQDHQNAEKGAEIHAEAFGHDVSTEPLMEPKPTKLECHDCGRTDFETIDELLEHECTDGGTGPVLMADGGFEHEESQFSRRVTTRTGLEDLLTDMDVAMQNMFVEVRDGLDDPNNQQPVTVQATLSITAGGPLTDGGEEVELDEAFVSAPSVIHDYAPDPPEVDPGMTCVECGTEAHNRCGSCGRPLCHKHHEIQAGFCSDFTRDDDDRPGCEFNGEFYHAEHLEEDGEQIDRGEGIETDGGEVSDSGNASPGREVQR